MLHPRFPVSRIVMEKVPFLVLSAASAVITVQAQRSAHAVRMFVDYGLLNCIENALISYLRYLYMAVWPGKLALLYPHLTQLFPAWQVAAAIAFLLAATAFVIAQRHRRPYLIVGWMWFVGAMFPMSGVVQVGAHALADRFAYIPFIGLFLIAVWTIAETPALRNIPRAWVAIPALVILSAFATVTHQQIGYWRDSQTVWQRTLAVTQNNSIAHDNLASYLIQLGREEEAAAHLWAALAIKPNDLLGMLKLGIYERSHGNLPLAIEHYTYVA